MDLREQKADRLRDTRGTLSLGLDSGAQSGQRVVEAKAVSKSWPLPDGGQKPILKAFSTRILRGDRVAVVGPNGAGKTTLLKVLLGEETPDAGSIVLGSNLEIAYVDQARMALSERITLWEVLAPAGGDQIIVRGRPKHVAAYAKDFLFRDSQLRQPVTTLSGGERNRLLLARALASPANLMVLDEPTNDLDMDTLDLLEDLLADYDGTLLLVSHDRDFIDRLATSTIAMNGRGDVVETPGGWSDFQDQNPDFMVHPRLAPVKGYARTTKTPAPVARPPPPPAKTVKLTYKDARRLEELEGLVARLLGKIRALEERLADPALYARDRAGFDRIMAELAAARTKLAASEDEWLALEEKRLAL
jgi:ATP-binding cassette subfamily F protein uup